MNIDEPHQFVVFFAAQKTSVYIFLDFSEAIGGKGNLVMKLNPRTNLAPKSNRQIILTQLFLGGR